MNLTRRNRRRNFHSRKITYFDERLRIGGMNMANLFLIGNGFDLSEL
ncbi:hypothetical protein [Halalkalibacter lacteus]